MAQNFSADFFSGNRTALRAAVGGSAPIVVTANGILQRGGDNPFSFKQDSSFWYLTGISEPDCTVVIGTDETYLITPVRSFEREAFDGAFDPAAFRRESGIDQILPETEGWAKLKAELVRTKHVVSPAALPEYMPRHGLYTNPARRRFLAKLKRAVPGLHIEDIRPQLAGLRCIKQPSELVALQQAIDITIKTIQEVRKPEFLRGVTHEYQIEAAISYGFRNRGSSGHAFDPVVASGKNATTLHHMSNNSPVPKGELIVLDIGAEVDHYAADVSRTISATPPTKRQAEVFQAVVETQQFAISLLKPGVSPFEYETAVEAYMGEQLYKLGLIKVKNRGNIRHYYPHATSHFLGLDTHDAGDYRKPYAAGMVITCEPGIYIPEEGIGVRIEDDLLITESGSHNLSGACPVEVF